MKDTSRPPTILIVEDEQALADLYEVFLTSYTVYTTYGGEEALDTISDEVDVVLLDRRMPGLSGEEVLEAIREVGYDCRVAMVTAVTPDVDILDMGFDDYVTKPIGKEDLVEVVERLLELNNYDELIGEYYQIVAKKAAIETEQDNVDLEASNKYNRLIHRMHEIDNELKSGDEKRSVMDIRSLLKGLV